MALKITLKPNERTIIGGAVVTNANKNSCTLNVENDVPVLRQKDIMSEKEADSPCSRLYFIIQLMYIDEANSNSYHTSYWKLVKELIDAVPKLTGFIDQVSENIISGKYYQALKLTSELMNYEQEVVRHA